MCFPTVISENLVALVDWRFIKLHKRQPGERDNPVPAKAGAIDAGLLLPVGSSGWVPWDHSDER